jgi:hypothetical protein
MSYWKNKEGIRLVTKFCNFCIKQRRHTVERKAEMGHPEAEFLDLIDTKVLGVFLLAIHSHLH